jgi:T5SS/PEP-CTERM-associated repeat protein
LTICSNFTVNSGGAVTIQNAALQVGGAFNTGFRVDGAASLAGGSIQITNDATRLIVGNSGRGVFSVSDGNVLASYSIVGANDGSDGTWRISGGTNIVAGGAFDIADSLTATGTVVVTGGRLEMPNAYVGLFGNGRLFISNGIVQCAGTALIGSQDGSQGTFIAAGGTSTFGGMQIRESSLASGSVLVTGNAQVQVNGPLDNRGSVSVAGGSLNVLGLLESEQPGNSISVTGGQLAVTNDNALLTSISVSNGTFLARDIFLGNQKVGNFTLAAGVVALSGSFNGFNIGVNGGTGIVSQTGGQIIALNTDLNIGGLFGPATGLLTISNGTASVQNVFVGGQGGGTGAVLMAGGTLSSGSFYLGSSSVRNQLIASNGAAVFTTGDGFIGFDTGAHSNSAALSGPATRWSISSNLYVGNLGAQNRLAVNNGAGVVSSNSYLGFDLLSISNTALVAGPGSTWSNTGDLFIGWNGRGNQVLVTNGGKVWNRDSELGRNGSSNNFVLLSGAGSLWSNAGKILLGRSGFGNQIRVTNGAVLSCSGATFGVSTSSRSNQVVVSGPGSAWSNSTYLSLGEDSAGNSLVISNGGVVACANCTIASGTPSGSNDAVLVGAGSLFAVATDLVVGHQGRANRLAVTDGAEVFVGRGLILGNHPTATNNRIEINGGTVRAPSAGTFGGFDVRRGTNVINSGQVEVGLFWCTNTLGFFEFNGGTLATGTTTNNNGRLFTVGNGTNLATLRLNGGSHFFANNLVLSTNATLTGSGTIFGAVTNRGTIAPGASAGRIGITGPLILSNGSDLRFEIGGAVPGSQYDQITISNTITHAGTVNVQFINGFTPSPGQVFQLLTAPSRSGTFANISLPVLPTGYVWTNRLTVDGSISVGAIVTSTQIINPLVLPNGSFQFAFTNLPGLAFNILTTTNLALPVSNWTVLGPATELTPGQYRFTDPGATNQTQRFYRVSWP